MKKIPSHKRAHNPWGMRVSKSRRNREPRTVLGSEIQSVLRASPTCKRKGKMEMHSDILLGLEQN
jgi:hypothetical protein